MRSNVNEKSTFNPPEEIGDTLFFSDFNVPKRFIFYFNKK